MKQEIWTMSAQEIDRLALIERVESAGLKQANESANGCLGTAFRPFYAGSVEPDLRSRRRLPLQNSP